MIVVADSSPLIILAKVGCFNLLNKVFPRLYISAEVHREVVIDGAGLPGASEIAAASWIEVKQLKNPTALRTIQQKFPLGAGELGTIFLAKELSADTVLLDDYSARKLAKTEGFQVRGSIGLLETFYQRGHIPDLRSAFQQLLIHNAFVDRRLLNHRLNLLGLAPMP